MYRVTNEYVVRSLIANCQNDLAYIFASFENSVGRLGLSDGECAIDGGLDGAVLNFRPYIFNEIGEEVCLELWCAISEHTANQMKTFG